MLYVCFEDVGVMECSVWDKQCNDVEGGRKAMAGV